MIEGQWYPGNMARATAELEKDLKAIDLVVELIDSRIPKSSRNPVIAGLSRDKMHLLLLHKADRADKEKMQCWLSFFMENKIKAMPFTIQNRDSTKKLLQLLKTEYQNKTTGRFKRPLRMIIVGIPNVGKSTLINHFVHRAVTKTGNQPGITRGKQWIRIMPEVELLDTPGILWPRINDDNIFPLAVVGALPVGSYDHYLAALWLIDNYRSQGKEIYFKQRYKVDLQYPSELVFEQIGTKRGALLAAGRVNFERTASLILHDFQDGHLGRITLESPEVEG